ncbi:MAG: winged helix-turn-helix domain-containing protein [Nitrososphaeraceae archaeon]
MTLSVQILKMIKDFPASEIARKLDLSKQRISYYIRKLKVYGYIQEITSDRFKVLEVTQAGKNFIAMYENSLQYRTPICRAENIRFKAEIIRMPSIPVDWHKVEMHNWDQYNNTISGIKVHIILGNQPTIEFIPGAIDGDNPDSLRIKLLQACTDVAVKLESILNMKIGRLELSSRGEWVVYDPVAHTYAKQFGQITIDGVGKVNASKPSRIGAFEFFDPRDCADYMDMPKRLSNLEQDVKKILALLKKNVDTIETDNDSQ